ncbi:RQC domain-containing protein, partial [Salinispira pacifica]
CRRQVLLAHFDEEHPGGCGNCDVCAGQVVTEDITEQAQMLLSAAVRTGERFGAHHLVDIVTGTATDKVLERGHNTLPTFGVGADRERGFWLSLVRELEDSGHLVRAEGERAGFKLSSRGRLLLTGKETYLGRSRPAKKPRTAGSASRRRGSSTRTPGVTPRRDAVARAGSGSPDAPEEGLYLLLKEMRKSEAEARGVPAFVIFSDRTLRDIAALRPRSPEELLECHGVGQQKLAAYGERVFGVVREFLTDRRGDDRRK